jgi:transcriptional regulator with XRE-family HTH domain
MKLGGDDYMDTMQVGGNILFYLNKQNKTQVDLANGLGASKQVVNKIIKGKKAIKTEELVAISNFLEVTVEDLINGRNVAEDKELDSVLLYGTIKNHETADFIISLITNLSDMEEELVAHGLLK